jgi:hypothetical protein
MDAARALHGFIEEKYHPNTYAYYAADPKQLAWNEVHWKSEKSIAGDIRAALINDDDLNGTIHLSSDEISDSHSEIQKTQGLDERNVSDQSGSQSTPNVVKINGKLNPSPTQKNKYRFQIQKAKGPGDGTVPEESGSAPTPHVIQIFRHEGKDKGHESYDHQNSYNAKIAQAATLYSIVKIVAESSWLKENLP